MALEDHRNANGTYDGVGVMNEMTGLSRADLLAIAATVRANHALLAACPRHDFQIRTEDLGKPYVNAKYRCKNCKGEVDRHAWYWHQQGQRA